MEQPSFYNPYLKHIIEAEGQLSMEAGVNFPTPDTPMKIFNHQELTVEWIDFFNFRIAINVSNQYTEMRLSRPQLVQLENYIRALLQKGTPAGAEVTQQAAAH